MSIPKLKTNCQELPKRIKTEIPRGPGCWQRGSTLSSATFFTRRAGQAREELRCSGLEHVWIKNVSITHLCLMLDLQWWYGKHWLNVHYDLSLVPPRLLGYGAEQDDIVLILGQDRLEDFLAVILGKLDLLKAPWHISASVLVSLEGDVPYAWNNTLSHLNDVSTSSAIHQNNNFHTLILKKGHLKMTIKTLVCLKHC